MYKRQEEKRQRYYRAIRLRAGDMEALADNLSSFTRLETEELRVSPVAWDLSEFVKRLLEDYSVEAEKKNILFLNEVPEKGIRLLLDETEMKRVFQNFFENSVKYRTSAQSVIRLWCRRQEDAVEIGVSDLSLIHIFPVMFGVLTTENIEQAIERAGTKAGNKGYECAEGAIEMVNLIREIER